MYLSVHLAPVSATTVVVALTGELDASTAPILAATLDPLPATPVMRVVVAAGELWFCDLAGLGRLFTARRELRAKGGDLILTEPSPALRRLIALLEDGRGAPLPVYDTLPEALAAVGAERRPPRHLPRLRGLPVPPVVGRAGRGQGPRRLPAAAGRGNPVIVRSALLREQAGIRIQDMERSLRTIQRTQAELRATWARCAGTLAEARAARKPGPAAESASPDAPWPRMSPRLWDRGTGC